jgi:hypothetical protein
MSDSFLSGYDAVSLGNRFLAFQDIVMTPYSKVLNGQEEYFFSIWTQGVTSQMNGIIA